LKNRQHLYLDQHSSSQARYTVDELKKLWRLARASPVDANIAWSQTGTVTLMHAVAPECGVVHATTGDKLGSGLVEVELALAPGNVPSECGLMHTIDAKTL
jgi:hypothetical protein